jgi:hypothetical protein
MYSTVYMLSISNPAFPTRLPRLHSSTLTAQGRVAQYVLVYSMAFYDTGSAEELSPPPQNDNRHLALLSFRTAFSISFIIHDSSHEQQNETKAREKESRTREKQ